MEKKIYDGTARISVTMAGGVTISTEVEGESSADFLRAFTQIMELLTFDEGIILRGLEEVAQEYEEWIQEYGED